MTTPSALILIVEDEAEIALILSRYLEQAGYRTLTARDGDQALTHCQTMRPDLMLLDLNIPRRDGFQVLAALRQNDALPVIVISALSEDDDKLSALRIGADDYVTKPFNPKEVVARVAAVLRRMQPAPQVVLRLGNVTLDPLARRVTTPAGDIGLTDSEYRLMQVLLRHPGRAFSRAELLDGGLEDSDALERTVDSHMSHLRRKLKSGGADVEIAGVRGFGYRLDRG
ncbi:response regulator transcription factor [Paracoccus sp. (in: a-proteobacteria)]|uniref:response regulator transcription factor n=1 Tax=Paracoccus sp. TaxID=267 RepID=UPI0026DF6539|nr:response regulator transcription factor [Paracoccus sp. (in: a-proteobacteria)]MDO5647250.1 response regulator transcription factor [Paracoccus sp. (in: a-proteobacteria)]